MKKLIASPRCRHLADVTAIKYGCFFNKALLSQNVLPWLCIGISFHSEDHTEVTRKNRPLYLAFKTEYELISWFMGIQAMSPLCHSHITQRQLQLMIKNFRDRCESMLSAIEKEFDSVEETVGQSCRSPRTHALNRQPLSSVKLDGSSEDFTQHVLGRLEALVRDRKMASRAKHDLAERLRDGGDLLPRVWMLVTHPLTMRSLAKFVLTHSNCLGPIQRAVLETLVDKEDMTVSLHHCRMCKGYRPRALSAQKTVRFEHLSHLISETDLDPGNSNGSGRAGDLELRRPSFCGGVAPKVVEPKSIVVELVECTNLSDSLRALKDSVVLFVLCLHVAQSLSIYVKCLEFDEALDEVMGYFAEDVTDDQAMTLLTYMVQLKNIEDTLADVDEIYELFEGLIRRVSVKLSFPVALQKTTSRTSLYDSPTYKFVNEEYVRFTGRRQYEILGKSASIYHGPHTRSHSIMKRKMACKAGEICKTTLLMYRPDGSTALVHVLVRPILDGSGNLRTFLEMPSDVQASLKIALKSELFDLVPRQVNIEAKRATHRLFPSVEDNPLLIDPVPGDSKTVEEEPPSPEMEGEMPQPQGLSEKPSTLRRFSTKGDSILPSLYSTEPEPAMPTPEIPD